MNVICINDKYKNITIGNRYEIIEKDDSFYYILNDLGITAKYSRSYFKEEEQEFSLEAFFDEIEFSMTFKIDNFSGEEEIIIKYNRFNKDIVYSIEYDWVSGNCGTRHLKGIDLIGVFLNFNNDILNIPVKQELFLEYFIEEVKNNISKPFLVFSTTDQYPIVTTFLDKISDVQTEWKTNPNGGNQIKIWIIYN